MPALGKCDQLTVIIIILVVFLRVLEYYTGILFLTTNRIGVLDEAFTSRIHISLHYPALNRDSTQDIFLLNLNMIKERFKRSGRQVDIDKVNIMVAALDYYDKHPKARWNGRQIRNACQTALALAEFTAQGGSHEKVLDPNAEIRLRVDDFKRVTSSYLEFTKYLAELYGVSAEQRAMEAGLRARESVRALRELADMGQVWGQRREGSQNQPSYNVWPQQASSNLTTATQPPIHQAFQNQQPGGPAQRGFYSSEGTNPMMPPGSQFWGQGNTNPVQTGQSQQASGRSQPWDSQGMQGVPGTGYAQAGEGQNRQLPQQHFGQHVTDLNYGNNRPTLAGDNSMMNPVVQSFQNPSSDRGGL